MWFEGMWFIGGETKKQPSDEERELLEKIYLEFDKLRHPACLPRPYKLPRPRPKVSA